MKNEDLEKLIKKHMKKHESYVDGFITDVKKQANAIASSIVISMSEETKINQKEHKKDVVDLLIKKVIQNIK